MYKAMLEVWEPPGCAMAVTDSVAAWMGTCEGLLS